MMKSFLLTIRSRFLAFCLLLSALVSSCIEPPLHLPGDEVMVDVPVVLTELEVVWNVDVDWQVEWYYGWDVVDKSLWGDISYPTPTNYEVRRYFLGEKPSVPHTEVDAFTIFEPRFRRYYNFGYYDLLLWSNIDSENGSQTVEIDESNLDQVHASTTKTRGMTRVSSVEPVSEGISLLQGIPTDSIDKVVGLFNQPEVFYATYPQDIFISHSYDDYDYFDEQEQVWVKKVNATLTPLVYIYLVQVIIKNNNGKIKGCSGENAISNISAGTSVNTGHTWNLPCMAYFSSRMKFDLDYQGEKVDIIGGKFTTYGLCDMPPYTYQKGPQYDGSRTDLPNHLYMEIIYSNGAQRTLMCDVTDQMRKHAHGGVITIVLDAADLPDTPSQEPSGTSSVFVPTIEDYEEVEYDIVM